MPNNRKGKWQPFDALKGYKDALSDVEKQRDKVDKPLLSEDELMILNYKITSAYKNKHKIKLEFYQDGFIKNIEGKIIKIDQINRKIHLDCKVVNLDMVTNIQ